MKQQKTIIREEVETDRETGEIKRTKHTVQFAPEPAFIKLYLDCLGIFTSNAGLDKSLNDMLLETLKYMSYADNEQVIFLNSAVKARICKATGKSMARFNQTLTIWVKEKVLKRVDRGAYQVNPWIFGKGDWRDIEHMRATFSFDEHKATIESDFRKKEDKPAIADPAVSIEQQLEAEGQTKLIADDEEKSAS